MRRLSVLCLLLWSCLPDYTSADGDDDEEVDSGLVIGDDTDADTDRDTDTDTDRDTDTDTDTDRDTDTDTDRDTDTDTDTDTDSRGGLSVDAVFFQFEAAINNGELVTATVDGSEVEGIVYVWFADTSRWSGTDDTENGCVIPIALTAETGSAAPEFDSSGYYFGWAPDLTAAVGSPTDSCSRSTICGAHRSTSCPTTRPSGSDRLARTSVWRWKMRARTGRSTRARPRGYVSINSSPFEVSYGFMFGSRNPTKSSSTSGSAQLGDIETDGGNRVLSCLPGLRLRCDGPVAEGCEGPPLGPCPLRRWGLIFRRQLVDPDPVQSVLLRQRIPVDTAVSAPVAAKGEIQHDVERLVERPGRGLCAVVVELHDDLRHGEDDLLFRPLGCVEVHG